MLVRRATLADAYGLARVHVDTWQATYRGMVADSFLDGLSYERSAKGWERTLGLSHSAQRVFVALDNLDSVVGFSSGGPNRDAGTPYKAELYAIYVLPEHHHRGLGKALFRQFAGAALADGLDSVVAWVLTANSPSRRFYEAMGGSLAGERQVVIGGQSLNEVAYGWSHIRGILGYGEVESPAY